MGKRDRKGLELERVYEGREVLGALLAGAGSPLEVDEVVARMREAIAEKEEPRELFPTFFEAEPRFGSPDEALRLYSNLFGLWDRVASGASDLEPRGPKQKPPKREPVPAPPPTAEALTDDWVEAAWKHLADLPPKEKQRLRDRFDNTEDALIEWLRQQTLGADAVYDNAESLGFECWAMLALAGRTLRAPGFEELDAALRDADAPSPEPALDRYVADAAEEAVLDEEEPLTEAQAAQAKRLARAAVTALLK